MSVIIEKIITKNCGTPLSFENPVHEVQFQQIGRIDITPDLQEVLSALNTVTVVNMDGYRVCHYDEVEEIQELLTKILEVEE